MHNGVHASRAGSGAPQPKSVGQTHDSKPGASSQWPANPSPKPDAYTTTQSYRKIAPKPIAYPPVNTSNTGYGTTSMSSSILTTGWGATYTGPNPFVDTTFAPPPRTYTSGSTEYAPPPRTNPGASTSSILGRRTTTQRSPPAENRSRSGTPSSQASSTDNPKA